MKSIRVPALLQENSKAACGPHREPEIRDSVTNAKLAFHDISVFSSSSIENNYQLKQLYDWLLVKWLPILAANELYPKILPLWDVGASSAEYK